MSKTIISLFVALLGLFFDNAEVVSALLADIITVGGIIAAWIFRYQNGDITPVGIRKE